MHLDARVPVVFAAAHTAGPLDAVLHEGTDFQPGAHPAGCPCCQPRNAAGRALAALLQDRARGKIPFFTRVLAVAATPAGRAEIKAALAADPIASACFRLEDFSPAPPPAHPHPPSPACAA